jgi:hypothetical protein
VDTVAGKLLVCDTTMFSSTAGGLKNLLRFLDEHDPATEEALNETPTWAWACACVGW